MASVIDLERQSLTAAHWTEDRYQQALHPVADGAARLILLAQDAAATPAILGFLVALHLHPEWELENIVVAAHRRREGVGKLLLESLLSQARKTGSEAVFLEVRETNGPARSFYEKAGFEQTGRRKSYYTHPAEDAILYRLRLR